jgi:glucose-1-phosphate thymidylyltransferase
MLAGVREQLIITTPRDAGAFRSLLGDGSQFGMSFEYEVQDSPRGLADAFLVGEKFIGESKVALALGDNIFHGSGLGLQLSQLTKVEGAHIFAYKVADPENYGVVEFNSDGAATSLIEKPTNPKSSFAIPGLYFYDNQVVEIAKSIRPSQRGEVEITSINARYLEQKKLFVEILPRGTAWLDTGTPENLLSAATYVKIIEERQGYKVACLEEIALRKGWITIEKIEANLLKTPLNSYYEYVSKLKDI